MSYTLRLSSPFLSIPLVLALVPGCDQASESGAPRAPSRPTPTHSLAVSACSFDRPDQQAALLVTLGNELIAVRADGTNETVHRFAIEHQDIVATGEPPIYPTRPSWSVSALSRDGHILASASTHWSTELSRAWDGRWWSVSFAQHWSNELLLLDDSARPVWQRSLNGTGSSAPPVFLGRSGGLAIDDYGGPADRTTALVRIGGAEYPLDAHPMEAPSDSGQVLVWRERRMGWLAPQTQQFQPARRQERMLAHTTADDRLIYLIAASATDGPALIVEDQRDLREIGLPPEAETATTQLDTTALARTGWLYLPPLFRVHLESGTVVKLAEISRPPGLTTMECGASVPQLMDDGSLLLALQGAQAAGLYRSTDDGQTWARLGSPVSNVTSLEVVARAGTFVIRGDTAGCSYRTPTPEVPNAAALSGPSFQVARPDNGAQTVLPAAALDGLASGAALSHDGQCLAFWTHDPATASVDAMTTLRLHAFELASGQGTELLARSYRLDQLPRHQAIWLEP